MAGGGSASPSGMRSKKMQKRQPTILEKQLEAARRHDFEALLSGQNPQGLARMKRLATVVKLRESLPRPAPTPEPGPKSAHSHKRLQTAAALHAGERPYSTQSSVYSDMTAMSGSTVYLHDDKLVKKLPFVRPSRLPHPPSRRCTSSALLVSFSLLSSPTIKMHLSTVAVH